MKITAPLAMATMAMSAPLASAGWKDYKMGKTFKGTAMDSLLTDFIGNKCAYDEFSSQFISAAESRFALVSKKLWDDVLVCGRCAEITVQPSKDGMYDEDLPSTTIQVMLTDFFDAEEEEDYKFTWGDGDRGNIMLSSQAYRELLNGGTGGHVNVEWKMVQCNSDFVWEGVEFAIGEIANEYELQVQPRNFHGQIGKLEVVFEDGKRYEFGDALPPTDAPGSFRYIKLDGKKKNHSFKYPFKLVASQVYSDYYLEVEVKDTPEPYAIILTEQQFEMDA